MLVTVYIPTRNRLALLKRAIASVKAQSYSAIELVVVDDGSTDGTGDYLRELMDAGQLRAVFHPHSLGACQARNTAINLAAGEFVTGLDDDDYFLPHRIAAFVEYWQKLEPSSGVAGLYDSHCLLTKDKRLALHQEQRIRYADLRLSSCLSNQVFAPKQHYIQAGLFDPDMPAWQDWELWGRMACQFGDFINIQSASLVVDAEHVYSRITDSQEAVIRAAYQRMCDKLAPLTAKEQISLLLVLHSHAQITPQFAEWWQLIKAGQLVRLFRNELHRWRVRRKRA